MLRLESVRLAYGPIVAVDDASITVGRGEVVAIVGGNGAGKSTMLKGVTGLVVPSAGRVRGAVGSCLNEAVENEEPEQEQQRVDEAEE